MPNIQNLDQMSVRVICRLGDQIAENTFLYSFSNVIGTPTDQDAIDDISAVLGNHVKACMSSAAEFRGCVGQLIQPLAKLRQVISIVEQGVGDVAGDPLPKQICGIITRHTIFAGRHHQGRVYVPFPSETHNDAALGRPNIAYLGALGSYAGDMWTTINVVNGGNQCDAVPYRVFQSGTPPQTFSFAYTGAIARDYWGTQRRRGDFGPKNISPI